MNDYFIFQKDSHIDRNGTVTEDQNSNWSLFDFNENSEYLVYKLVRNIISCDKSEDLTIEVNLN